MERTVEVATGESVAFTYELAGLGSRFFAVFVDMTIQFGVLVVAVLLLAWVGVSLPTPKAVRPLDRFDAAVLDGLVTVALFLLFFGYFIFFEWRDGGRTPGKRLLGIRAVRDGGFPLDFTAAVVRNVVRILEFALGFYALSAVSTLLSPLNRRLGDFAAGTIVVRDQRYERYRTSFAPRDGSLEGAPSGDALVRDLSDAERDLIRRYADRRAGLTATARAAVAASIATGVRAKLEVSFNHLSDDELLVHLAATALR
jgi:uncharacterized RDD family membrane protein YckC